MARIRKQAPTPEPEEHPFNAINDEVMDGETLDDYMERLDVEEEAALDTWAEKPRHKRKVNKPAKWLEHYDPNMGTN